MTNDEAINVINVVRNIILKDPSWLKSFTDKVNEAVDMAIESLKTQNILCEELADMGFDTVCDDLSDDSYEWEKCSENCENIKAECWKRWALMTYKKTHQKGEG